LPKNARTRKRGLQSRAAYIKFLTPFCAAYNQGRLKNEDG